MKKLNLSMYLFLALILGVIVGELLRFNIDPSNIKPISEYLNLVSTMFLRLIKMVIAPLVFVTLVTGITKLNDGKSLGRIFTKSMIIFVIGGFFALGLGWFLNYWLDPGLKLHGVLTIGGIVAQAGTSSCVAGPGKCDMSIVSFLNSIVPNSMLTGFVENHILQVLVVAMFFGIAGLSIGEPVKKVFDFFEMISEIMFKITANIMKISPIAVFSSICSLIMTQGVQVISSYLIYLLDFYLGIAILWIFILLISRIIVGRKIWALVRPVLRLCGISFVASSSEVTYPAALNELTKYGVKPQISGLVMPLGYSFNLLASMFNCAFATIFIIHLYGFTLTTTQEIALLLMLMVTSKGIAGVPRVSLIIVASTLVAFGYPEAGVLILFPIDSFLDMGRSATNVMANVLAVAVVDKLESKKHTL